MSDVTLILNALEQGDDKAVDRLLPVVYQELRQLAAQKLANERSGHTLQATALVHEAYMRLIGTDGQSFKNRQYFFGAAAEAMRRILTDNARRKQRYKRGGSHRRIELDEALISDKNRSEALLVLDEALSRLSAQDPDAARLVTLRYFSGHSLDEVAQILGMSRRTVSTHWNYAKAWLYRELTRGETRSVQNGKLP